MLKREEIYDPDSSWNKTADDEPVFVLRAKDPLAPDVVGEWILRACTDGLHVREKLDEVEQLAEKMVAWRRRWMRERQPQKQMSFPEVLELWKKDPAARVTRASFEPDNNGPLTYIMCPPYSGLVVTYFDGRMADFLPKHADLQATDWIIVPKERQFGSHAANTCASGVSENADSKTKVGS